MVILLLLYLHRAGGRRSAADWLRLVFHFLSSLLLTLFTSLHFSSLLLCFRQSPSVLSRLAFLSSVFSLLSFFLFSWRDYTLVLSSIYLLMIVGSTSIYLASRSSALSSHGTLLVLYQRKQSIEVLS